MQLYTAREINGVRKLCPGKEMISEVIFLLPQNGEKKVLLFAHLANDAYISEVFSLRKHCKRSFECDSQKGFIFHTLKMYFSFRGGANLKAEEL